MKNQQKATNISSSDNMKQFQQAFTFIFSKIVSSQEQLDTLRQLLNQQISFNLKDLYVLVAGTSSTINFKHIVSFLVQGKSDKQKQNTVDAVGERLKQNVGHSAAIQSFIRYYNRNSSLNLSFSQFSTVFLNRQNRLLMKMTLERESIGTLPNYILNFSRKILSKQIQLHLQLMRFRKFWSMQTQTLIQNIITQDQNLDQQRAISYLCEISGKSSQRLNIQFDIFLRYITTLSKNQVQKWVLCSLLTNTNSQAVDVFLKERTKKRNRKVSPKQKSLDKPKRPDPFIRPEFHDCLTRPKITDMFSYRQVKSIQKHLDRLNQTGLVNKGQIDTKLRRFQSAIQKNCQKVLQAIKNILWFQKEIQYARVQLSLCPDFYPVLFFECFHKDKQNRIIPSAMQIYIKQFGINIPLGQIYLLFKRYAWHLQGKMDFNSFCAIFDVCEAAYSKIEKNRQIKSLADVDVQTKKNFLILLATIIKNQKKIDCIKSKLQRAKHMNLRDVFACFDTDDDGYLSITDFRVVWKKYYNLQISKQMIQLLWFRMGYNKQNQIIRYQEFIKQMVPKSNLNIIQQKKLRKVRSQDNVRCLNRQNTKKIK